jgi:hypothetical protein
VVVVVVPPLLLLATAAVATPAAPLLLVRVVQGQSDELTHLSQLRIARAQRVHFVRIAVNHGTCRCLSLRNTPSSKQQRQQYDRTWHVMHVCHRTLKLTGNMLHRKMAPPLAAVHAQAKTTAEAAAAQRRQQQQRKTTR